MREVTDADIPGLKLALEHCTKYEDRQWFSFLIKMHARQAELNRPRLRIIGQPKRGWNNGYDYDAVYSENGREQAIQFHVHSGEWLTEATLRNNAEHALYMAGWQLTRCSQAEIVKETLK